MSFCTNLTFKACNTDPYVSLTLLHAGIWWKGIVNRLWVVFGTKLDGVLCWDFALLVVLVFWLTGAKPDYPFIMGIPVHGRVRRQRNVWWFGVVHRKKEFTIWETYTGILGDNIIFKKCNEKKNLQSGKPSQEYWVTTFFSKCQFMRSLKTQDRNWLRYKRTKLWLDSNTHTQKQKTKHTHIKGVQYLLDRKVLLSQLHSIIVHHSVWRQKSLRGMAL